MTLLGCDEKRPELSRPLSDWRASGVPIRLLPTVGGPVLQVPVSTDVSCIEASPDNARAVCGFTLDETTARLLDANENRLQWLRVGMVFDTEWTYAVGRREARLEPQLRAGGPPPEQADLEQTMEGQSGGRHFGIGCWPPREASDPDLTNCTLVIENRSIGTTSVTFWAVRHAPIDGARVARIIGMVDGIEGSFLPR